MSDQPGLRHAFRAFRAAEQVLTSIPDTDAREMLARRLASVRHVLYGVVRGVPRLMPAQEETFVASVMSLVTDVLALYDRDADEPVTERRPEPRA